MPSLVEIQYNPYLPQVNMLIDGKQLTSYSRLVQYTDEDIWKWASDIMDTIYAEIRDEYNLCFIGNDFDADILRQVCREDKHCIGFKKKEFVVSDHMQTRMGRLNQLIKKAGITIYDKTIIDANFFVSAAFQYMLEEINSIDINNLFCAVRVQILGAKCNYVEDETSILFIIAEDYQKGYKYLSDFELSQPAYVIIIGNETKIINVTKRGWFIETKANDLFETIFRCFLQKPLVIAFRNCIKSMHAGNKVKKELEIISSIEPVVNVSVESEVEVGRSIKVNITLEPDIGEIPKLIFNVRNQDIASCDGINLYGLKEGKSVLEVYKQGSSKPLFTKEIKVYERNRVTRLLLSDDNLSLGIGDKKQLKIDYYPYNADNVDEITWKSSDENIVAVDSNGRLAAKNAGKCRIICIAENVSTQCMCTVMPYMEDIIIDTETEGCIHMTAMQETILSYRCLPPDCIDRKLTIISSDNDIVNVVNETLYAKNEGNTQITIVNESGRVSRTLEVVVESHIPKKKKGGFFKKLFS